MLRTDGPNPDDGLDPPLPGVYNLTAADEAMIEDAYQDAVAMFGRTCPVCGRSFVAKSSGAVYDRDSCRVVAWQRRQRKVGGAGRRVEGLPWKALQPVLPRRGPAVPVETPPGHLKCCSRLLPCRARSERVSGARR